jgi:hypothetical protein
MWPIYLGGSSRENVNCLAYHEDLGLLFVGGNTTSSDFGPSETDHGFLYALDSDGNLRWGNFYYNVSYAITDISGCTLDTNSYSLAVLGMANSVPIVMEIDLESGRSISFVSLENRFDNDDFSHIYKTFGAIHYNIHVPSSLTVSFLMNNQL